MAANQEHIKLIIDGDSTRYEATMKRAQMIAEKTRKSTTRMSAANEVMSKSFQKAAVATATLHGPLNGVSGRLSSLASAFRIANTGLVLLGASITAISVAATKSVKAFTAYEVQLNRLIAVQEATGYAAGFTGQQINEMSREIAMATLASTEGMAKAAAALGTFGSITGETFEKALKLSQDLAEAMGTDVRSGAVQMGKALEDPKKGLDSLSRAGVTFTETAEDQIDAAIRFGDIMTAQGILLEQIAKQFGGVAEAVAKDTIAGAFDTLGQNVEDFGIKLSKVTGLASAFRGFIEWLNSVAVKGTNLLEGVLPDDIQGTIDRMKELDRRIDEASSQEVGGYAPEFLRNEKKRLAAHLSTLRDEEEAAAKAAEAGRAAAAKKREEARRAAYKVLEQDFKKSHARMESIRLRALEGITSGSSAEAKEGARLARQVARAEEVYRKQLEGKQLTNAQQLELDEQFHATVEALETEHQIRLDEIKNKRALEASNKSAESKDAELKKRQKNLDLLLEEIEAYVAMGDAASSMFATLADASQEGSAAMKTFVLAERAALLFSATGNMFAAATKALNLDASVTVAGRIAAYAAVLAAGANSVAAISSLTLASRASGGMVRPNSSYWVGEDGPEIITTGSRPGMVTANKDLVPTVIINEDATRAGQVEYDAQDQTVSIAVSAVMNKLTNDLNSGRGVFGQAEQRYGLRRNV